MSELTLGEVIADRYRLTKVLGEGGMGAVYEAIQINLNREVAIKVMHAAVGMADDAKARFEREAKVTGALHHPNAVKIFDFGEDGEGRLYLVMEKLRGTTLRSFVAAELPPMPLARSVNIALQIAQVLVAAHELGLVHRDLKPENIFLEVAPDGTDRVVVVDFGLAFIEERPDANRMTQEGMIMGTPFYMSPEQCHGKGVGGPTDVYALGCMLYEMVTSFVPFEGQTVVLLTKHVFEPPVPPGQRRGDVYVPRALESLIMGMLEKKPEARPTPPQIVAGLGQLEHTLGERERVRGREFLEGRQARMIPTVRGPEDSAEKPLPAWPPQNFAAEAPIRASDPGPLPRVAVILSSLPDDLGLGLRANGYEPVPVTQPPLPEGTAAVWAPGSPRPALEHLLTFGVPVLTDADPNADMTAVSSLLTLGVAEVLTRPVKVEKLAKKIGRALKKHKRRSRR